MKLRLVLIIGIVMFSALCDAELWDDTSITRYEISREAVLKTINESLQPNGWGRNITVSSSDLQLPKGFTSKEKSPALEVIGILWNAFAHEWQVSMRCRERSSCASFLVLLTGAGESNLQKQFPGFYFSHRTPLAVKAKSSARPALVQSGKPAVLVMQSSSARITLPVVCLQRGVLDQVIDTRDPETKKILRATVIGPNLLQAAF